MLFARFSLARTSWSGSGPSSPLHDNAVLLGSAFPAQTFGLRDAGDADHIAAIDKSTRELMQQGQQPVGVGFSFTLGHSLAVLPVSIAAGSTASRPSATSPGRSLPRYSCFLLAGFNTIVLTSVWRNLSGCEARRIVLGGRFRHPAQQPAGFSRASSARSSGW